MLDSWRFEALPFEPIYLALILRTQQTSREGIFQLGMESLPEWKVETKTEYSSPSLLSTDRTSCSSFLSIPHCLHCSTSDLEFVKNCLIDSKLLGCNEMRSFSNMFPQSSYCFPNTDSRFSKASFKVVSPSRWNKKSQDII